MAKKLLRLLRRSTALALALTAGWVIVRTAGLTDAAQALHALSQDAEFALFLVRSQLPAADQLVSDAQPSTRAQRLLAAQSPLLNNIRLVGSSVQTAPPLTAAPEPDQSDEDLTAPQIAQQDPDRVIPRTFVPSQAQSYLRAGDIYIANRAEKQPDAAMLAQSPVTFSLEAGPQVLILHSHATEAYSGGGYTPSDPYRTTDCDHNMVRVGEEIARTLRTHGLEVIHDTTLYDYPSYGEAYDRSLAAAERWLSQYPTLRVVLDVHRDALEGEDGSLYKAVCQRPQGQAAQVMLVVGTDGAGKYHPLWQENLTFGLHLQRRLLDDHGALARPMVLRSSRFNQHLCPGSLLVEVGTHGNTLDEALLGARLFAESAAGVLTGLM